MPKVDEEMKIMEGVSLIEREKGQQSYNHYKIQQRIWCWFEKVKNAVKQTNRQQTKKKWYVGALLSLMFKEWILVDPITSGVWHMNEFNLISI